MYNTVAIDRKGSLFQQLVFSQLSKMNAGSLTVKLPNGEQVLFGDGSGTIAATITINHPDFFRRLVLYGDIGFGEAYTDGLWDTDNVTQVISWVLLNVERSALVSGGNAKAFALNIMKWFNELYHIKRSNTLKGSRKNISEHYDLNNDFFQLFLDPTMTYSGAYFSRENMSLEEAQLEKYKRLCTELHLQPSDHVLEIGSGWGGNAIYIAKHYGCKVTSLTLSAEQQKLATERIEEAGLSHKIEVRLQDYREVDGTFDKIVSIEMLEAVGHKYLTSYFEKCSALLNKDGILGIQVITCPDSRYENLRKGVDWIQKHIFPGSLLPSVGAINDAVNQTGDLTLVDLKDIGLHYATTLKTWCNRFNSNILEVKALGFDDTFIRKWNYYLCYCEAAFAMRNINVMQLVYVRPNNTKR